MNPPLFPIGFEAMVSGYFGLQREDAPPAQGAGRCRVEGLRLIPDVDEEWDSETQEYIRRVAYPDGWEYQFVTPTGSAWGWIKEAELLAAGYAPPVQTPEPQTSAA